MFFDSLATPRLSIGTKIQKISSNQLGKADLNPNVKSPVVQLKTFMKNLILRTAQNAI